MATGVKVFDIHTNTFVDHKEGDPVIDNAVGVAVAQAEGKPLPSDRAEGEFEPGTAEGGPALTTNAMTAAQVAEQERRAQQDREAEKKAR